jgi:phenylpyruvate tautomerase PptA (4-oxalocrotonate tautomerase family)
VPYLQVDLPNHHSLEVKRDLARRMGDLYAEIMQTTPDLVDVGFRELGEGNVWRCGRDAPQPTGVLLLEIRRGRPPEQRARLAQALIDECSKAFDLRPDQFTVEFTQHTGDESFRDVLINGSYQGGFAPNWSPDEANNDSFLDSIPELQRRAG